MSYNLFLSAVVSLPLFQIQQSVNQLIRGLTVLFLFLILAFCLVALLLTIIALLPQATNKSKLALQHSPWQAFFIGLANYVFLGGISLFTFNVGIDAIALIGLAIISCLTIVTSVGLGGLVTLMGERLSTLHNQPLSSLKQLIWAIITLTLAGAFPFIGWFLLTPIMFMVAFGSAVLAWRNKEAV